MLKKTLSLLFAFIFVFASFGECLIIASSSSPDPDNFSTSIMDKFGTSEILKYLNDETIFYKDKNSDTIYVHANGAKKTSDLYGFTSPYFDASGDVYIKSSDVTKIKGITLSGTNFKYGSSEVNKSHVVDTDDYVSLTNLLNKLGFNTYIDNRGFIMTNFSKKAYENKTDPYAIQYLFTDSDSDLTDAIFRYMNFDRPSGVDIVNLAKSVSNKEANLLTTPQSINIVNQNIENGNEDVLELYEYTISEADALLNTPCQEYEIKDNLRLLQPCQNVKDTIITLSSAYLLTNDTKYLDRIYSEISYVLDATHWPNWNCFPHSNSSATNINGVTTNYTSTLGHFLDSGFLSAGVAIGYDILRSADYLTDDQKISFHSRIKEVFLDNVTICYNDTRLSSQRSTNWYYAPSNWGCVVPGGALSISLALAKDADLFSTTDVNQLAYIIENSLESLEFPYTLLYPDGSWYEGPSYWKYISEFLVSYCIYPLITICQDDYGFMDGKLLKDTFNYVSSVNGSVYNFNFGETEQQKSDVYLAQGYLLSSMLNDRELMENQFNLRKITSYSKDVRDILWFNPQMTESTDVNIPVDSYFTGAGVGVMRGHFYNQNSSFVGVVAGENADTGFQYEKGSFVFDLDGVRWACDLGTDNYNARDFLPLPKNAGTGRQRFYRYRTEGNNCIVINPEKEWTNNDPEVNPMPGQNKNGVAIVNSDDVSSSETESFIKLDLTSFYDDVTSYKRGLFLGDDKTSLTIRDEIKPKSDSNTIYWFMHTQADISISDDGKTAVLTNGNKKIIVKADTSQANWTFGEMEANYLYPKVGGDYDESTGKYASIVENGMYRFNYGSSTVGENSRQGYRKLYIKLENVNSDAFIEVKMSKEGTKADLGAISTWQVDKNAKLLDKAEIVAPSVIQSSQDGYSEIELIVPRDTKSFKLLLDNKVILENSLGKIYNNLFAYRVKLPELDTLNGKFTLECSNKEISDVTYNVDNLINKKLKYQSDFSLVTNNKKPLYTTDEFNVYTNDCGIWSDVTLDTSNDDLNITFNKAITSSNSFIQIGGNPSVASETNLGITNSFYLGFDFTTSSDDISMYLSSKDLDSAAPGRVTLSLPELANGKCEAFFNYSSDSQSTYVIYIKDSMGNILNTYTGTYDFKSLAFVRITPMSSQIGESLTIDKLQLISYDDISRPATSQVSGVSIIQTPQNNDEVINEDFSYLSSFEEGSSVSSSYPLAIYFDAKKDSSSGATHISPTIKDGGINVSINDTRADTLGYFQTSEDYADLMSDLNGKILSMSFDIKADNNFSFYISAPSGYNTNYLDCKKVDGTFEFILTNNKTYIYAVDKKGNIVTKHILPFGETSLGTTDRLPFLRFSMKAYLLPTNVWMDNLKINVYSDYDDMFIDSITSDDNTYSILFNDNVSNYSVFKALYCANRDELLDIEKIEHGFFVTLSDDEKIFILNDIPEYVSDTIEYSNIAPAAIVDVEHNESNSTTMKAEHINDGITICPSSAERTVVNSELLDKVVVDGKTYRKGTITFDFGKNYNIGGFKFYTMDAWKLNFKKISAYLPDGTSLASYDVDVTQYEAHSSQGNTTSYGITYVHPAMMFNNVVTDKIVFEYLIDYNESNKQTWFSEIEIFGAEYISQKNDANIATNATIISSAPTATPNANSALSNLIDGITTPTSNNNMRTELSTSTLPVVSLNGTNYLKGVFTFDFDKNYDVSGFKMYSMDEYKFSVSNIVVKDSDGNVLTSYDMADNIEKTYNHAQSAGDDTYYGTTYEHKLMKFTPVSTDKVIVEYYMPTTSNYRAKFAEIQIFGKEHIDYLTPISKHIEYK